ncbi:MAG: DUF5685 family protein [Christensenellales bacterium]|jgi:hypothetical protein
MFGYVTCDKPNMLIKDFNDYRAYYCGLCKTLGALYGQPARFGVNYDIVLLALLAHNYEKLVPEYYDGRCVAHPIGAKRKMLRTNHILQKVAHADIIMGYYKLEDNVSDDGGIKYRLAKALIKGKYKKAKRALRTLDEKTDYYYSKMRSLELSGDYCLDSLADCFSQITVEIGRSVIGKEDKNLYDFCYNLGRWIYIIDAADDFAKDIKKGKFNPFRRDYEGKDIQALAQEVKCLLTLAINNMRQAYDNMDITVSEGPLSNIVYMGFAARMQLVLKRLTGGENESV